MKQLDGLRAVAVFGVLYTHYFPEKYWLFGIYWGGLGVKFFFVLSGFLITGILLKCRQYVNSEQQTSLLALRQFYIRRFLRIFPLFYTTLALAAILNIPPVRQTIVWHILYLSNVYFAIQGNFPISISHLWSLAVEEQFYLLWPWLVLFLPKRAILPAIIFLIFIGPLFRLVGVMVNLNEVAIWVLTPGSLDSLGLGSLLAYLKHREEQLNGLTEKIIKVCFLTGFPLLLLVQTLEHIAPNMITSTIFGDISLGLTFTWLVAQAAEGFRGITGKALEFTPLVYLGKISYGIYVIHLFIPYLINKAIHLLGLTSYSSKPVIVILLSTAVTLILAMISWHFLEKPINNFKKFFPYKEKVA